MKKERRSHTYPEAYASIAAWAKAKHFTPTQFHVWLENQDILITRQYASRILRGSGGDGAGPHFIAIFEKVTGVKVVKGLVEDKEEQ